MASSMYSATSIQSENNKLLHCDSVSKFIGFRNRYHTKSNLFLITNTSHFRRLSKRSFVVKNVSGESSAPILKDLVAEKQDEGIIVLTSAIKIS